MTENYYVKIALILEKCIDVKADSPDDAKNRIDKILSDFDEYDDWSLIDYNIEVQDDE